MSDHRGQVCAYQEIKEEEKKRAVLHWNVLVDGVVYRQASTGCIGTQLLVDSFVDVRNRRFATGGGDWARL